MSAPVEQPDYSVAALAKLIDEEFPIDDDARRDRIAALAAHVHERSPSYSPYWCCYEAYEIIRDGGP